MENIRKSALAAVILALGIVAGAGLLSKLFVRIQHEQAISVKGYAQQDVISDAGTFYCAYTIRRPTLNDAYVGLKASRNIVQQYLREKGFADSEMILSNISTSELYKTDEKGHRTNTIELYKISQGIRVTSSNVRLILKVSQDITELIKEGLDISSLPPEFYVSDLQDIKIELLAQATRNGRERAQTLATNSGGQVGKLKSASQGVFQITAPNSTQTSGYGVYDTSTIQKTVKAVVTLQYEIE